MRTNGPGAKRWVYVKLGAAVVALSVLILWVDSVPLMESARSQLWGLNSLHYADFEARLPARQNTKLHLGVGPGELQPEQPAPRLQPPAGVFPEPLAVSVSKQDPAATLRCTLDGSIPTQRSPEITTALRITDTTVVRCRSFRDGYQASVTATQTYFISAPGKLPLLALTLDPTNLANKYTGIYARFNERGSAWERDAHIEYFPRDGTSSIRIDGRIRIHGFYSRTNDKKSFRLYYPTLAPDAHDDANLLTWHSPHPERVVVLGASERHLDRDVLFQDIYRQAGGYAPSNQPVSLYLNAQYWGIYFLRERIDEDFLHRHFGGGQYDLLDMQPGKPRILLGDDGHWRSTVEFFEMHDFEDPTVFAQASKLIDVENFTDYWLFNVFAANRDWPHHNMYMFRRRDGVDGRWRWISWDADATFDFLGKGLTHDTLAWATRSTMRHDLRWNSEAGLRDEPRLVASTLIARKLLENREYKEHFARRLRNLLTSSLNSESTSAALRKLNESLQHDLDHDLRRWDSTGSAVTDYASDLIRVEQFILQRPSIVLQHLDGLRN